MKYIWFYLGYIIAFPFVLTFSIVRSVIFFLFAIFAGRVVSLYKKREQPQIRTIKEILDEGKDD